MDGIVCAKKDLIYRVHINCIKEINRSLHLIINYNYENTSILMILVSLCVVGYTGEPYRRFPLILNVYFLSLVDLIRLASGCMDFVYKIKKHLNAFTFNWN